MVNKEKVYSWLQTALKDKPEMIQVFSEICATKNISTCEDFLKIMDDCIIKLRKGLYKENVTTAIDISIVRHLELEAMMVQGRKLAEDAKLVAGFMGGNSRLANYVFIFLSIAGLSFGVNSTIRTIQLSLNNQVAKAIQSAVSATFYFVAGIGSMLRVILMRARLAWASYTTLICTFAPLGILFIILAIMNIFNYVLKYQYSTTIQVVIDVCFGICNILCGLLMILASVLMKMRYRQSAENMILFILPVQGIGWGFIAVAKGLNHSCENCTTIATFSFCLVAFLMFTIYFVIKKLKDNHKKKSNWYHRKRSRKV
mmetsp:Transcript_12589/g.18871  ORF Transcript_12589/g.18871 Transcript_12589/m.18871 type:complete len:314 (+) Transcript_12589:63-1004(+)